MREGKSPAPGLRAEIAESVNGTKMWDILKIGNQMCCLQSTIQKKEDLSITCLSDFVSQTSQFGPEVNTEAQWKNWK